MKKIIDLSWPLITDSEITCVENAQNPTSFRYHDYICINHELHCSARAGTHLELASHCVPDPAAPRMTRLPNDDVLVSDIPIGELYEMPAVLIRLKRDNLGPAVSAQELVNSGVEVRPGEALLVQAQSSACKPGIGNWQYMYFGNDAVDWIVDKKVRLFGSDIWENHDTKTEQEPRSVKLFLKLWQESKTWCLIYPNNLDQISKVRFKLTVMPIPAKVTAATSRVVAIEE